MYAYKEILTLENPQQLNLSKPLPFLKGKKVEVLIIVEDDSDEQLQEETDYILQNNELMQQIALSVQSHEKKNTVIPPITQSLIGILQNSQVSNDDYKKHLENKYL